MVDRSKWGDELTSDGGLGFTVLQNAKSILNIPANRCFLRQGELCTTMLGIAEETNVNNILAMKCQAAPLMREFNIYTTIDALEKAISAKPNKNIVHLVNYFDEDEELPVST